MSKAKKTIAVIMGIAFLFTAFIVSATGGKAVQPYPDEKRMEITWIGPNPGGYPINITEETDEIKRAIEDKFNIVFNLVEIDVGNEEQYNLFLAEGGTFDGLRLGGGKAPDKQVKLIEQDLIREIEVDWLYKYMPNSMRTIESLLDKETVEQQLTFYGKYYYIPTQNYASVQPYIVGIREDWMEKVGISKLPKTLDEFTTLLKKFTFEDPDGNGKDDTYGLHGTGYKGLGFNMLWGAFGMMPWSYYLRDGKVVYTSVLPEFKEALNIAQSWYKEGLIDPEFVTDKRDVQRKKWAEGKFGVLPDHPWWFASSTEGNITAMVTDNNPDAKITYMPSITGPYGKSGYFIAYPIISYGAVVFGKQTSDEKVKKIMEIRESGTDWDWYVYTYYGKEGVHYTMKDGFVTPIAEVWNAETQSKWGLSGYFIETPLGMDHFRKLTKKEDLPAYEVSLASTHAYDGVAFPFTGTNEANKLRGADIEKIADEFFYNAITGKINIDTEWDSYVKKLNSTGLKEIIAEYQEYCDKQK